MIINEQTNPYRECIQGRANEPITVRALLERAERLLKSEIDYQDLGDYSLPRIVERLYRNHARVVIIAGSPDHPAHLLDHEHILRAAAQIWRLGGVPFSFGLPVICDGTAQSNIGQSYSLASRNISASTININFEGHSYHAAYVLTGCDKTPMGILSGLLSADLARRQVARGSAPVWAMFAPSHVLQGGRIPHQTQQKIQGLIESARARGEIELADDIQENCRYILQCSSDEAFLGHFKRAVAAGLLTEDDAQSLLNELAAATCHANGGICAFHGTGNSSRMLLAALGLVHPEQELLTKAPDTANVNAAIETLFQQFNRPEQGLIEIVAANFANCVRIHCATGGSSNLMLHLVGMMRYAGFDITLDDYDRIRCQQKIPDIFSHSLTEGRDTYVLAQQYQQGLHRGNDSLVKILQNLGVSMDMHAPTITGQNWQQRCASLTTATAVDQDEKQRIIYETALRPISGVDVLRGNFFNSCVLKVAAMSDQQYQRFDKRVFITRFYQDEEACLRDLRDPQLINNLANWLQPQTALLQRCASHNGYTGEPMTAMALIEAGWIAFALVIAGQGPQAFGMPEMFAPSQNLRHHQVLEKSSMLITDGRYSGVTKGACVGHMTPEAFAGGAISVLQDGDLLWVQLQDKRIDLIETDAFIQNQYQPIEARQLAQYRHQLQQDRQNHWQQRRLQIASSCLLDAVTDAERGVVPTSVDQRVGVSQPSANSDPMLLAHEI